MRANGHRPVSIERFPDGVAGETVWGGSAGNEASPIEDEHDPLDDPDEGVLTEEDVEEEGI